MVRKSNQRTLELAGPLLYLRPTGGGTALPMSVHWGFRYFVAWPAVRDLLISAKYLFVTANSCGEQWACLVILRHPFTFIHSCTSLQFVSRASIARVNGDVAFGSALRNSARYEGVPAAVGSGVVSLQLMKGLTMRRTIAHMNPPAAVPYLTRPNT